MQLARMVEMVEMAETQEAVVVEGLVLQKIMLVARAELVVTLRSKSGYSASNLYSTP